MQLKRDGKAFSHDTRLPREFGQKYPSLFDEGFLDTASTRYSRRKDKTLFQTPPGVIVFQQGRNYHFKRIKIL